MRDAPLFRFNNERSFLIDEVTRQLLDKHKPDIVGLTVPFPGTVYAAFRVAACVRRHASGGGNADTGAALQPRDRWRAALRRTLWVKTEDRADRNRTR